MAYFVSLKYSPIIVCNLFNGEEQNFRLEDTVEATEYKINFSTGVINCVSATSSYHSIDDVYILNQP